MWYSLPLLHHKHRLKSVPPWWHRLQPVRILNLLPLQLRWHPLPVKLRVLECPLHRQLLRYVTNPVIAGLIAQCPFHHQISRTIHHSPHLRIRSDIDVARQPEMPAINRNSFIDRRQMKFYRWRIAHFVHYGGIRLLHLPIDRDVAFHAWSVHVHVRLQVDIQCQRHPLAGGDNRVACCRHKFQLLAFHFALGRRRYQSKLMRQNVGGSIALAVVVFEIFGDDYALGVQNESTGIRDTKKWLVLRDRFVQQTQFANNLRIRVRQQWIMDSPALGKTAQYRHAVITDGRYSQTKLVELGYIAFQLHELGFTEWSPVRRAVKQNHRSLRTQQAFQTVELACLIGEFKRR